VTPAEILTVSHYRDAELRGAQLIYLLLRLTQDDPEAQLHLTRQLADEARHALLWSEHLAEAGADPVPVRDGYQVRMGRRVGRPRGLLELLCLTYVVEQRAIREYGHHAGTADRRTAEKLRGLIPGTSGG